MLSSSKTAQRIYKINQASKGKKGNSKTRSPLTGPMELSENNTQQKQINKYIDSKANSQNPEENGDNLQGVGSQENTEPE